MKSGGRARRNQAGRTAIRGFSLVEVLVAFTVLALFIAAAFQVYVSGIRSTALAGEYARAHTLARSRLDTLAALPAPVPREDSGRAASAGDGPTFRWRAKVTSYPVPGVAGADRGAPTIPLLAVVEVTWNGESGTRTPRRFEIRALLLGEPR